MTPRRKERISWVAKCRQAGFILVLEDIHDPHNAAAMLRTCDAFGVQDVWFVFEQEKPFNPRQVGKTSSSSANRWLSFKKFASAKECVDELKAEGYTILATALGKDAVDPYKADLAKEKIALVVGNEHRGVSEVFLQGADMLLTIPMRGFVESLNVSVAAALLVAEITRQREASGKDMHLDTKAAEKLAKEWSKKS